METSSPVNAGFCPVCRQAALQKFAEIQATLYHRCPQCLATLMDPASRLDAAAERAIYELHENSPDDPGYRQFIRRLTDPLIQHLKPGSQGLDYGCGPGSALAAMLREQGFEVALYDPFFVPDPHVLERQYDFVTCTEAAEHFFEPLEEFKRLDGLLRPGGVLGVMTSFLTQDANFPNWHYRRDPTHVVFYKPETMQALARLFHWRCETVGSSVAVFHKPDQESRNDYCQHARV